MINDRSSVTVIQTDGNNSKNLNSNNVKVFSDRFEPEYLKIKKGDVVRWRLDGNQFGKNDDSQSSSSLYEF